VPLESWLPIGFQLPDGARSGRVLHTTANWQIFQTSGGGCALVVKPNLVAKWIDDRLVEEGVFCDFLFGPEHYCEVSSGPSQLLAPVSDCRSPIDKNEALAFAVAFKATRDLDHESPLQDAIYIEKISRLLPSYGVTSRTEDDIVLGYWLTGGARVSVKSFRRLRQMLSWMEPRQLRDVVQAAGFAVSELMASDSAEPLPHQPRAETKGDEKSPSKSGSAAPTDTFYRSEPFTLPGRPQLEAFFNEYVVDIIRDQERYKALGIGFPSAIVLHGPPGCGKTFAVEQLIDYLAWPSFQIDASGVASPYIHETSRKVAEIFDKARQNAPSVLMIDEMEAFLADRERGAASSHHRVEEVAEFLRRIPEATKNEVLVVAMTNRIEMIDPAVMRRGRFDHVIKVDYATAQEVLELLQKLLLTIPQDATVDPAPLAQKLIGRPLSDVAFVVREGARLAVRAGREKLGQTFLLTALESAPSRTEVESSRRIGFV